MWMRGSILIIGVAAAAVSVGVSAQPAPSANGWQIPENAREEKSPLEPTAAVLKKGKSIFESKCARCHGPEGKGDGPDGEKAHPPANLTDASRAIRNPDGIMFYKVWNGRKDPKMPAFKSELTKDEVWAVVEYAKSLRKQG
jgi:mono/diheme cytochrome c family protein